MIETYNREDIIDTPHNGTQGKYVRAGVYSLSNNANAYYIDDNNTSFMVYEVGSSTDRTLNINVTNNITKVSQDVLSVKFVDIIPQMNTSTRITYGSMHLDGVKLYIPISVRRRNFEQNLLIFDVATNKLEFVEYEHLYTNYSNDKRGDIQARRLRRVIDDNGNLMGWVSLSNINESSKIRIVYMDMTSKQTHLLIMSTQVFQWTDLPDSIYLDDTYFGIKLDADKIRLYVAMYSTSSTHPLYSKKAIISLDYDFKSGEISQYTVVKELGEENYQVCRFLDIFIYNSNKYIITQGKTTANSKIGILSLNDNNYYEFLNSIENILYKNINMPTKLNKGVLKIASSYKVSDTEEDYITPSVGVCYRLYELTFITYGFREIVAVKKGEKWKASCDNCVAFFKFPPYQELQVFTKNEVYEASEDCYIGIQGGTGNVTITKYEDVMFN